jgi:hypothetical protein
MPILGPVNSGSTGAHAAFAMGLDTTSFITACKSQAEARKLPPGAIVGATKGGLTFTDEVAATLESRSLGGWMEIEPVPGERWTVIVLNR